MIAQMFTILMVVQLSLFILLRSDIESLHVSAARHRNATEGLVAQVAELANAQMVPRVRRELELCADHAALLLVSRNLTAPKMQCTAVPMPRELLVHVPTSTSSSLFFLTSAHCFFDSDKAWVKFAWLASIFYVKNYPSCSLVSSLVRLGDDQQVLDLAVVACSEALPVPPTGLSILPPVASHEAVAMAGFSLGWHSDLSKEARIGIGGTARYALHARVTRLSSSLQLPTPANASAALLGAGFVAGSVRSPQSSGPGRVQRLPARQARARHERRSRAGRALWTAWHY